MVTNTMISSESSFRTRLLLPIAFENSMYYPGTKDGVVRHEADRECAERNGPHGQNSKAYPTFLT